MRSASAAPLALVFVVASSLVTVAARGDAEAPADARARADADFAEGQRLLDAGQVAAACAKLASSQRLDPKLGRLLNLAFCHEQEGKTASAWREYNDASAIAEQKRQQERVDFAREHAAVVAKRLAFLRLAVPETATEVEVDDEGLGRDRWSMAVPLDPGEHRVVVRVPGKKPFAKSVLIGSAPGTVTLPIAPLEDDGSAPPPSAGLLSPPPLAAPPAPEAPPAAPRRPSFVPAYVATGVAVAGLGVGIGFGVAASAKKKDADPHCPARVCDAAGSALVSDARSAATIATIGFGVGIAGALAATWLYLLPPGGSASARTARTRARPLIGAGVAGVAWEGTW